MERKGVQRELWSLRPVPKPFRRRSSASCLVIDDGDAAAFERVDAIEPEAETEARQFERARQLDMSNGERASRTLEGLDPARDQLCDALGFACRDQRRQGAPAGGGHAARRACRGDR